ncbi:MAG: hypothetical protein GY782_12235 [Gammaproteobacteria bacterium]|nr:hypothetical protein [Gammaproteobacteria bacterium]
MTLDRASKKEQYADYIINLLTERYIPDLKEKIIHRIAVSPVDYENKIISSIHGATSHGGMQPYQAGAMRPIPSMGQYRSSIANVYLCGAGSYPGPGVSMIPGRDAAQVICQDLLLASE